MEVKTVTLWRRADNLLFGFQRRCP
jgi:hypothetical protein